mgnify:CR=1 FL=1
MQTPPKKQPPYNRQIEVGNELRDVASKLYAHSVSISPTAYNLIRIVRKMPHIKSIQESVNELMFISNSVISGKAIKIHESRKKIENLLGFNFFV